MAGIIPQALPIPYTNANANVPSLFNIGNVRFIPFAIEWNTYKFPNTGNTRGGCLLDVSNGSLYPNFVIRAVYIDNVMFTSVGSDINIYALCGDTQQIAGCPAQTQRWATTFTNQKNISIYGLSATGKLNAAFALTNIILTDFPLAPDNSLITGLVAN